MTLVLTMIHPFAVFQVSDRRISVSRAGRLSVHSPAENKVLIVEGRDFIAVIAYAGLAYVSRETTDTWIASLIAGTPIQGGYVLGAGVQPLKLNTVVQRIVAAVDSIKLPPWPNNTLQVAIAGFRLRRKRWVSFYREVGFRHGHRLDTSCMRPANTFAPQLYQMGDILTDKEIGQIYWLAQRRYERVVERWEYLLREGIRSKSSCSSTVGPDLMFLRVYNPRMGREVMWNYEARVKAPEAPAYYSPWIMGPLHTAAPTFGVGHFNVQMGRWIASSKFSVPAADSSIVIDVGGQKRPPPPR